MSSGSARHPCLLAELNQSHTHSYSFQLLLATPPITVQWQYLTLYIQQVGAVADHGHLTCSGKVTSGDLSIKSKEVRLVRGDGTNRENARTIVRK